MRLLCANFVGEQSKGVLSYKDVLIGDYFDSVLTLIHCTKEFGYTYFLWNDRVYLADGTSTVYTREDIR